MIKLYKPSNATEFDIFQSKFCNKCARFARDIAAENQCKILGNMIMLDLNEKGYPKQICYVDDKSCCTSFKDRDEFNKSRRLSHKNSKKKDKLTMQLF